MSWWSNFVRKRNPTLDAVELDRLISELRSSTSPSHSAASIPPTELAQTVFFAGVFTLLGWLGGADGRASNEERGHADRLAKRLALPADQASLARALFMRGAREGFDPGRQIDRIASTFSERTNVLTYFLEVLFDAAWSDAIVHEEETARIRQLSAAFGFSDLDFIALEYRFVAARHLESGAWVHGDARTAPESGSTVPAAIRDAHGVLGVSVGADLKEVKQAYRELVREHHPDRLESLGVPPEMMQAATEMTIKLRIAYDAIVDARSV